MSLTDTTPRRPHAVESAAYARSRRHALRNLYAKRSPQLDSWAGQAEGDAGSRPPRSRPPQAGSPRRVATGQRPERLGRGPDQPVQVLRVRLPGYVRGGRRTGKRKRDEKEKKSEMGRRPKPAVSDRVWGRGAAGEASAGLKIERVNDVQRVESLAERTNRLAGKKQERPFKTALFVARKIG